MRRGHKLLLTFLVLLLAVPVATTANADDAVTGAPTADGLTSDHAVLHANIVLAVAGATASFQYGPTTAYGSTVTAVPSTLPKNGGKATAELRGLTPATTYHFRVVVTIGGITIPGPDATFTTPPAPGQSAKPEKAHKPEKPAKPEKAQDKSKGRSGSDDAPAPQPVDAPAPPVLGKSVAVGPVAGAVRVRKPHGHGFMTLAAGADVPTGSIVDATQGTVALTSALGRGATQTGHFGGGRFVVRQSKHDGMIDIYLRGSLPHCKAGAATLASAASASSKRRSRSLWGRDHGGRFRTHGASSVATVRGTRWLTRDSCAGTLTKVTQGVVSVRDLHRHRTVTVRAGHSYLARR